jgi:DnaJ-class molecular chaperone
MMTCPKCLGEGWDDRIDDSCEECGGSGFLRFVNCPDCGASGRNERPTCLYDLAVEGACQTCFGARSVPEWKAAHFFRRFERHREERESFRAILKTLDDVEKTFDDV